MSTEFSASSALKRVRVIADYQFGRGAGEALFPEEATFRLSSSKRVRYILLGKQRLATLRAHDGRLTLSREGAGRLATHFPPPSWRVVVRDDVREFVAAGKNAMAKHVTTADKMIRAGDEVLVTDPDGILLASGSAVLSGPEMVEFNYGVAVQIRKGK